MEILSMFSMIVPILIIGSILFFIFRNRDKGENVGKDAYYYVISFILVLVLYWALADLLRIVMEQMLGVNNSLTRSYSGYYSSTSAQESLLRSVSLRLSAILVGFPIWAFHWYKASKKPAAEIDYHSRKSYSFVIMIMMALGVIGTSTGLVYQVMNAILGVSQDVSQAVSYLLPYATVGAGMWVGHYLVWKQAKEILVVVKPKEEAVEQIGK